MGDPARSTVNLAVLAVVLDAPGHGYDVGQRFEQVYGRLFGSSANHVYRSLESLRQTGLVEAAPLSEVEDGPFTPLELRRKSFWRSTADGVWAVSRWLEGAIPPEDARRELWVRLRAVRRDDFGAVLRLLDRYEEALLGSVGFVGPSSDQGVVEDLAREEHDAFVEGQMRWLDGARELVRKRAAGSGS